MGDLASILKELRKTTGLTQEAFAKTLRLYQASVSRYESGKSAPSLAAINRIHRRYERQLAKMGYGRTTLIDALARRAG